MHTFTKPHKAPFRSGLAELELILSLPVIIGFTFALLWIGIAMETQFRMRVRSRHDACANRRNGSGAPLQFSNVGFQSSTSSEQVSFTPFSNLFPPAKASYSTMAGAWDYKEVDLNRQPSFKTFETLLASTASDVTQLLENELTSLDNLGENLDQAVNQAKDSLSPSDLSQLESLATSKIKEAGESIADKAADLVKELANIGTEIIKNPLEAVNLKKKAEAIKKLIETVGPAMDAL